MIKYPNNVMIKSPNKGRLRQKRLILAYSSRGIQYTMVGKKKRSSLGRHGGGSRRLACYIAIMLREQIRNRKWARQKSFLLTYFFPNLLLYFQVTFCEHHEPPP